MITNFCNLTQIVRIHASIRHSNFQLSLIGNHFFTILLIIVKYGLTELYWSATITL
nr:MAG TPA: hypothetical protein [Caudoviricetes sp.]